jgi:broad specificity phosphatase PhoE
VTEFLLVRHGETDWNRERRFQGHADQPLNDTGRAQAHELANELAGEHVDGIYSSDLRRAYETAEIIAARLGVPVIADSALREVDCGEWQGLTWEEIDERFPDGRRKWDERGHGWEDGETFEELAERVVAALKRVAAEQPGRRFVVVGHGGLVRSVRAFVEGRSVAESRSASTPIANCEVFRVRAEDGTFRGLD